MTGERNATLGHIQSVATIFSLVAVPVIVAVLGALIQKSIQSSEARSKSLELAISILKEAPAKASQPGLREWAIETLQASSAIQISDLARKELETKPLFPVQPVQRHYGFGGFITLKLDKPNHIEIDDPKNSHKTITLHQFLLKKVDQDSISLLVDGQSTSLYINDSLALSPEGCVLHVLGVGHDPTDEERSLSNPHHLNLEDLLKKRDEFVREQAEHGPLNSAFTAFVCP